jgi:hypothetical protein
VARELVVEVHRLFDQPKAEDARVEIEVSLRVPNDAGDVVDAGCICEHWT